MNADNYHARFVNLRHRTDRLAHMEQQLARIGLKAERIPGMYPNEYDGDRSKVQTMLNRTPGALGCHMSQVRIMKEARAFGKHALVMEDDIIFCDDFNQRMDYVENWMATNSFDIFWLGSSVHINPPFWHRVGGSGMPPDCSANLGYDARCTDDPRIIQTFGAFVTFAYIVNVNSIDRVLELLDSVLHESIGIDWAMVKLQPQLKCFAFLPGMVKQKDNTSDIGTGETIWSGFLKLNGNYENSAYVYQERMDGFDPMVFNWAEARL